MSSTASLANNNNSARTTSYTVRASDIIEVLCHRKIDGVEEYLVRWRTKPSPRASLSWHVLPELYDALHHVQSYVEALEPRSGTSTTSLTSTALSALTSNRKRKAPDIDPIPSRDLTGNNGLLTPGPSTSDRSRSPSDSGLTDHATGAPTDAGNYVDLVSSDEAADEPRVYNAILQKKAGYITAKRISKDEQVRTSHLPTAAMLKVAARTPFDQAEKLIRRRFMHMLQPVKNVYLENHVDNTTPSLNFTFVKEYVFRDGVAPADKDALEGCQSCKPNMGGHCGCEYTAKCECLEYAAVDEKALKGKDPEIYAAYQQAQARGEIFKTDGLPKRFPYSKPAAEGRRPQTLLPFYLEHRRPIYECNERCRCGPICKSRLVQKGRRVGLTIFKTTTRGWGVYCNEDLIEGEFVDTYIGEVITSQEADRRESKVGGEKNSYFYTLDKFEGDIDPGTMQRLDIDDCFVVDGQYMGGPTRFINHSCDPNIRQYTVSYNKHDIRVYQLAFFAYHDIPAGTELTFDYIDEEPIEVEDAIRNRLAAQADPANAEKTPCNCGTEKCRGFLW